MANKPTSNLWVDKYRPKTLAEMCAPGDATQLVDWVKKFKAGGGPRGALVSGPPGVGKTTSIFVAANSVGKRVIEFNASDHRSQKSIHQAVSDLITNKTLKKTPQTFGSKPTASSTLGTEEQDVILLMDEVDGCDRGGVAEIIILLKTTKIPILCTCNDVRSPKLKSLLNHVANFKFSRPRFDIVTKYITKILALEGCEVPPLVLSEMIQKEGSDIRSTLTNLQLWCLAQKKLEFQEVQSFTMKSSKDQSLGIFQAAENFFRRDKDNHIRDYAELQRTYYSADLVDLFVHENYVHWHPYNADWLERAAASASAISFSDRLNKIMYQESSWSLSPQFAFFSSIYPSVMVRGSYISFLPPGRQGYDMPIKFPQWLGNNSTTNKNRRICQIVCREGKACVSTCELATDVLPYGYTPALSQPMVQKGKEGIDDVCETMDTYNISREDWDWTQEVGRFKLMRSRSMMDHPGFYSTDVEEGGGSAMNKIPTAVKSAFTREFNKNHKKDRFSYSKSVKDVVSVGVEEEDAENDTPAGSDDDMPTTKKPAAKKAKAPTPAGKKAKPAPKVGAKRPRGKADE